MNSADAVFSGVETVDVPACVHANEVCVPVLTLAKPKPPNIAMNEVQLCAGRRPAVSRLAEKPVARYRSNDSVAADLPDAKVLGICNVDVAVGIDRDSMRRMKTCLCSRPAISGITCTD